MATSSVNINSGIHQLSSNCYPPSESDDEDSFVVLSNSLGPDVIKDSVLHTEPISTTVVEDRLDSVTEVLARVILVVPHDETLQNTSVVDGVHTTYSSTEFSPEEIQRKVDDLITENTRLKDTLAQNNIAMKKQVETLTQWQQDVQRVQESHKEKFSEMKKYISILKNENILLKNAALSDSKAIEEPKQISETVSRKNIMEFELEAAKKRIEELGKALDQLSLEKEDLLIEFTKKPDLSVVEEMEKLKKANENLTKDLKAKDMEMTAFENEFRSLLSGKNSVAKEFDDLKTTVKELTKRNCDLTDDKLVANKEVFDLQQEKNNLSKINDDLVEKLFTLQKEHEASRQKFVEEINALQNASKESLVFQEMLNNVRQQLMASQMHITELKQQNEKSIAEKDDEIQDLQKRLKQIMVTEDELTALRAQVDLYKSDFEIERRSKADILTEKNKIVEDLNHLQRRNQHLLQEVEQLRSGFVCVEKEEAAAPVNSALPKSKFSCPRCSFRFTTYQALENHVYRCIELDNLP